MRHCFPPEIEDVYLPEVLFALSDATRLGITVALADGQERAAGELGGSIAKSTTTHHLKILRAAGALRSARKAPVATARCVWPDAHR